MIHIFLEAATDGTVNGFGHSSNAMRFLESILGGIMYASIPVIGLVLMYTGLMFISARGNREKVTTAITNLTYVIVGIALVLGSYMIAKVVYNTIVKGILGWV